jgi:hypothetical protein
MDKKFLQGISRQSGFQWTNFCEKLIAKGLEHMIAFCVYVELLQGGPKNHPDLEMIDPFHCQNVLFSALQIPLSTLKVLLS